jgi:hypothetical protein
MEPINIYFLGFLFSTFPDSKAPLKIKFDERPAAVNLSMSLLYFSQKLKAPN